MAQTYQQALDTINSFDDPYLRALRDHGTQTWGLEGIRRVMDALGNPQKTYPVIHIAGTKGKGSTAAFIAQGLIESGLKTGLYTSPPLQSWRERIQVNRELIPEDDVITVVKDIMPVIEEMPLTAFEVTTALALWYFNRQACDVAVVEVGLGGRLDATSIVDPLVAVITNISMDHTQLLGDTLMEIAGEKAAIIKRGVPVVSAPQREAARMVIEKRARDQGSELTLTGHDWTAKIDELGWDGTMARIGQARRMVRVEIGLPGPFQVENATVALAALGEAERHGLAVTRQGRLTGVATATWPGRLEVVRDAPLLVLDGAHNRHSVARLVEAIIAIEEAEGTHRRPIFVFGCMADKDIDGMLTELLPATKRVILTSADHPRAAQPEELLERAQKLVGGRKIELSIAPTTAAALEQALELVSDGEMVCAAGSLSIVGEARDALGIAPGEAATFSEHSS